MKKVSEIAAGILKCFFYSLFWLPIVCRYLLDTELSLIYWAIFGLFFVYLVLNFFGFWSYCNSLIDNFLAPYKLLFIIFYGSVFAVSLAAWFYWNTDNLRYSWAVALFLLAIIIFLPIVLKPQILRDDPIGANVLVGIFFYFILPSIGWISTGFTDANNWRELYGVRVFFSVVIPVCASIVIIVLRLLRNPLLTKVPLLIFIPVLLLITALPIWNADNTLRDLYVGAQKQIIKHDCLRDEINEICICGGKEVSCFEMKKDEEISILPNTYQLLSSKPVEIEEKPLNEDSPENVVKGFYILYLDFLSSGDDLRDDSTALSFLSKRLQNWYLSKAGRSYKPDYFLAADAKNWNENWRVKTLINKAAIDGNAATVKITLSKDSDALNLQIALVYEKGEWKIDAVKGLGN